MFSDGKIFKYFFVFIAFVFVFVSISAISADETQEEIDNEIEVEENHISVNEQGEKDGVSADDRENIRVTPDQIDKKSEEKHKKDRAKGWKMFHSNSDNEEVDDMSGEDQPRPGDDETHLRKGDNRYNTLGEKKGKFLLRERSEHSDKENDIDKRERMKDIKEGQKKERDQMRKDAHRQRMQDETEKKRQMDNERREQLRQEHEERIRQKIKDRRHRGADE